MPISLIACVAKYKNKLVIGKDNELLVKLKQDLSFFKTVTSNKIYDIPNIVLMGHNTYDSIPKKYSPLPNRLNFILTNNITYLKKSPLPKHIKYLSTNKVYFIKLIEFENFYKKNDLNVFIIGGGQVYNLFLNSKIFLIDKIYLTEVNGVKINVDNNLITMNHPDFKYKLVSYSEKYYQENYSYRILYYKFFNSGTEEHYYFDLANNILLHGNDRSDRTGTGTKSIFGAQLKFDISNGVIPLLTTKQIHFKSIVEELLFFCRGDTDTKILDKKGVRIWNDNTTREFLDLRGLNYNQGIMGPMYGWSWRHFGAKYNEEFSDTSKYNNMSEILGIDQLKNVEYLLKTDPFSRRIYISNLNPSETKNMCLDMCHTYIQFYVTEENGEKYLSAYFTMRSSDYFLASISFNTISYTLLVYILALKCNMKPKEIIYNAVDCHIYKNHIEQIKEQMTRTPRPFPKLHLNENIIKKDYSEIEFSDFELIGYFPHSSIKAKMAV